jgi:hypothetical protein
MSSFTKERARTYMHKLLAAMNHAGGSELFIASDFPPHRPQTHGKAERFIKPVERPRSLPFTGVVETGSGALVLTSARGTTRLERSALGPEPKR